MCATATTEPQYSTHIASYQRAPSKAATAHPSMHSPIAVAYTQHPSALQLLEDQPSPSNAGRPARRAHPAVTLYPPSHTAPVPLAGALQHTLNPALRAPSCIAASLRRRPDGLKSWAPVPRCNPGSSYTAVWADKLPVKAFTATGPGNLSSDQLGTGLHNSQSLSPPPRRHCQADNTAA